MIKFIIYGRMPCMNEFIAAQNRNRYIGNKMKQSWQQEAELAIIRQLRGRKPKTPIRIRYVFYEPNKKRDCDNIAAFPHKVIQDALVETNTIPNDGWRHIVGFTDDFEVDENDPRIEITLEEVWQK